MSKPLVEWECAKRLSDAGFTDIGRRAAFTAGYSDRYYGRQKWSGNEQDFFPDAYRMGWNATNYAENNHG